MTVQSGAVPERIAQIVVWAARAAWLAVAVVGGSAVGDALDDRSRAVQITGTVAAWIGWAVGAGALAIAGVVTLTLARTIIPGSLVVAAVALAGGADPGSALLLVVPAVIAAALVGSAEFGRAYIQASAYGDEERFGLRPPIGYLMASGASWLLTAVAVVVAPVAWAAAAWIAAVLATAVAVAGLYLLPVRWHQLTQRWLVIVPAGVVVHDPVLLNDTLMMPARTVRSVALDERGCARQSAADLTGPTPGLGVEIALTEPATAVLAAGPGNPAGRAIHLSALVISPTRPGSVIRALRTRGYRYPPRFPQTDPVRSDRICLWKSLSGWRCGRRRGRSGP